MQDLANCCSPVFCIISGNVNCGKSSLLKNILVHKNPHYERIVVYSPLGEATTEYSDVIDCELIDYVPDFDFFDREITIVILSRTAILNRYQKMRDTNLGVSLEYMHLIITLMCLLLARTYMIYYHK